MTARNGPPDEETAGPAHQPGPTANTASPRQKDQHRQFNGAGRRERYDGPYDPWRAGFRRGAIDALRLAARRIDDPHVWMVLSELREWYETEQWGLAG